MYEVDLDKTITLGELVKYAGVYGAKLTPMWSTFTMERKKTAKTCAVIVGIMRELYGIDSSVAKWLIHTESQRLLKEQKANWRAGIFEDFSYAQAMSGETDEADDEDDEDELNEEWEILDGTEETPDVQECEPGGE